MGNWVNCPHEFMFPGEITAQLWREKSQSGGKLKEKLYPKGHSFPFFPLLLQSWFTLKILLICRMTAGTISLGFTQFLHSPGPSDHRLGMMFTPFYYFFPKELSFLKISITKSSSTCAKSFLGCMNS